MAQYISKMKIGSTIYSLKDTEMRAAVSALETAVASSLVFKGTCSSATDITGLVDYKLGWTYKATTSFTIEDLGLVENGDMIICINSNSSFSATDWTIVQNNTDVMVGATTTTSGTRGLVPSPVAGDEKNFLCGDGTWKSSEISWGSFSDLI